MQILQICSAQTLGGGEVHVGQLASELRRRGHEVEIAGRRGSPLPIDHLLGFRNSLDAVTALGLRRIIARGRFDIVHAHIARDYPIASGALIGCRGPRLVLTRQLIHRVRPNPLYRRVDGWIATTGQIARTLEHLRPKQLRIIPNWVDTGQFPYHERPFHDPIVIGLLGQISPHKGHDDAIQMMEHLGSGFRLVVGGTGRGEYRAHLERRASRLPVEFVGFVRPEEFLRDVDVLILPSWEEPFGIVVLEAMAAGVNVVATRAGGPPEILDHGNAGVLVPPRNPEALADAVRKLTSDRQSADAVRRRARQRVEACYELSEVVGSTERFYADLLAGT